MVRVGCRIRSPCQGRSASRGQLGHSLEPRSGSRIWRGASLAGLPEYLRARRWMPRSLCLRLTSAEPERREETARAPVDGGRELAPGLRSQAERAEATERKPDIKQTGECCGREVTAVIRHGFPTIAPSPPIDSHSIPCNPMNTHRAPHSGNRNRGGADGLKCGLALVE